MRFTRGRVWELKNAHNSVTVQNRTHVYMNFFDHKNLGNHLLQLCPKVVKHPVYEQNSSLLYFLFIFSYKCINTILMRKLMSFKFNHEEMIILK